MFDSANPLDDLDLGSLSPAAAEAATSAAIANSDQAQFGDFSTDVDRPQVATLYRQTAPAPADTPVREGDCLYFDLETAPDWGRAYLFGLPDLESVAPETPLDQLMDAESFISSTLKECGEYLSAKIPPAEWLDAVLAAENARDKGAREGMLKLIKSARETKSAADSAYANRIKLLSVTPLYCRIVAIGMQAGYREDPPEAILCKSIDDERAALTRFWGAVEKYSPLVGFNIRGFDVPVLLCRSIILGITPPRVINRGRYSNREILDLMQEIHGDRCPSGFGLKPTCRMLGIHPDADEVDGSQVNDLVEASNWDAVAEYVRSDVRLVQRLHRDRLSGVFCV